MKYALILLTAFSVFISTESCFEQKKSDKIKCVDLESVYRQNMQDSILVTGWYYILGNENGFKRQLDKTEIIYYIDPKPILVKEHFDKIEIYKTNFQGQYDDYIGLSIRISKNCEGIWADATEKSIGKKLGLIIDNVLVSAPTVNMRIEGGVSALNRDVYSREELKNFEFLLNKQ